MRTTRLEAFSDGVIAMNLMARWRERWGVGSSARVTW